MKPITSTSHLRKHSGDALAAMIAGLVGYGVVQIIVTQFWRVGLLFLVLAAGAHAWRFAVRLRGSSLQPPNHFWSPALRLREHVQEQFRPFSHWVRYAPVCGMVIGLWRAIFFGSAL